MKKNKKKRIKKIKTIKSTKTKPCPTCGGKGELEITIREENRIRVALEICRNCGGSGRVVDETGNDNDRGIIIIDM